MTAEARLVQDLQNWGAVITVFQPAMRLLFHVPAASRVDILHAIESDGWRPIPFGKDSYEIDLLRPRQKQDLGIPT